jgi:hypothetical protein
MLNRRDCLKAFLVSVPGTALKIGWLGRCLRKPSGIEVLNLGEPSQTSSTSCTECGDYVYALDALFQQSAWAFALREDAALLGLDDNDVAMIPIDQCPIFCQRCRDK